MTRKTRNVKKRNVSNSEGSIERIPRIAMGNNLAFGFPPKLLTKLRYADTYAMVSTAGTIAKQVMNINSIFDPDSTGVGHQPLYRDTYAAIYDQYAVVSATIKATYVSLASTSGVHAGLVLDDDSSVSNTITTLMEQNLGVNTLLSTSSGALSVRTLTGNFNCKRDLGIDPYASETYKTAVGSNPTEDYCALVWMVPADGSSTVTNQVVVEIEYTVLWTELSTPTSS